MGATTKQQRRFTLLFYNLIREEYCKLSEQKKYTHSYIVATLSEKFFRSERTIENIIFNRV